MADDRHPLTHLDADDLEFVSRLVLASGSLKELAESYGVSYPTIRNRLDRVRGRLADLVAGKPRDPMAELLADLIARGDVSRPVAERVLQMHRQQPKGR